MGTLGTMIEAVLEYALIMRIRRRLLLIAPLALPTGSFKSHLFFEASRTRDNQCFKYLKVVNVSRDAELIAVSIFLPSTREYGYANTKRCQGGPCHINIEAVTRNGLTREKDGSVIVQWKYQAPQQIQDQILTILNA
ncbi:hypothetical protein F4813DRAFT_373827 [Daldinia decipiens]|uniref:uncharacterized protein n=1 Tax=Daldinia decipiens TaxID=326647 RepID=UPI0020C3E32E|nr:uncharacterized protein F4813DRAFT_373827 [Daldinia decipiens]KAI1653591.1 hypothetical protein F4813DRAFT_373827 [Daldinia decipiens]